VLLNKSCTFTPYLPLVKNPLFTYPLFLVSILKIFNVSSFSNYFIIYSKTSPLFSLLLALNVYSTSVSKNLKKFFFGGLVIKFLQFCSESKGSPNPLYGGNSYLISFNGGVSSSSANS